jgi:hypothetical protein
MNKCQPQKSQFNTQVCSVCCFLGRFPYIFAGIKLLSHPAYQTPTGPKPIIDWGNATEQETDDYQSWLGDIAGNFRNKPTPTPRPTLKIAEFHLKYDFK